MWDYFIGSDLNGTPVPTKKGLLLQAVEKQYIKGKGGMLALDPSKPPDKATVWFFPTGNRKVGRLGGRRRRLGRRQRRVQRRTAQYPALCAFNAIDGYLYVVSQDVMGDATVAGPDLRQKGLKTPVQVAKDLERRRHLDADHRGGHAGQRRATTSASTCTTSSTRRPRRATPARCPAPTATAASGR